MQSWLNWYSTGLEIRHSRKDIRVQVPGSASRTCSQVVKTADCNSVIVGSNPTMCFLYRLRHEKVTMFTWIMYQIRCRKEDVMVIPTIDMVRTGQNINRL